MYRCGRDIQSADLLQMQLLSLGDNSIQAAVSTHTVRTYHQGDEVLEGLC